MNPIHLLLWWVGKASDSLSEGAGIKLALSRKIKEAINHVNPRDARDLLAGLHNRSGAVPFYKAGCRLCRNPTLPLPLPPPLPLGVVYPV